jgi:hypothetical protein
VDRGGHINYLVAGNHLLPITLNPDKSNQSIEQDGRLPNVQANAHAIQGFPLCKHLWRLGNGYGNGILKAGLPGWAHRL